MKILYIHGFASAGFGTKVNYLRQAFGAENVVNPTLPIETEQTFKLLDYLTGVMKKDNLLLVGSSQGGFYSIHLSYKHAVPAILINPQTRVGIPQEYIIGKIQNFKTNEEHEYRREDFEYLKKLLLTPEQIETIKNRIYVYKDQADEVIDYKITQQDLKGAYFKLFAGGSHEFMHMKEVLEDLKKLFKLMKNKY
jgi:predicted esterase YcpF (UPF0227 family)